MHHPYFVNEHIGAQRGWVSYGVSGRAGIWTHGDLTPEPSLNPYMAALWSQRSFWSVWSPSCTLAVPREFGGFPSGSTVKNPPVMQEMQQEPPVQSLGWEDLLEKQMATHSCIFAWEIPRTEEPSGLQSMASQSQTPLRDRIAAAGSF